MKLESVVKNESELRLCRVMLRAARDELDKTLGA